MSAQCKASWICDVLGIFGYWCLIDLVIDCPTISSYVNKHRLSLLYLCLFCFPSHLLLYLISSILLVPPLILILWQGWIFLNNSKCTLYFRIMFYILSTRTAVASWFFIVYLTSFNSLTWTCLYKGFIISSHSYLPLSIPCSLLLFGSCYFIHLWSHTKSYITRVVVPSGKNLSLTTILIKFLDLILSY